MRVRRRLAAQIVTLAALWSSRRTILVRTGLRRGVRRAKFVGRCRRIPGVCSWRWRLRCGGGERSGAAAFRMSGQIRWAGASWPMHDAPSASGSACSPPPAPATGGSTTHRFRATVNGVHRRPAASLPVREERGPSRASRRGQGTPSRRASARTSRGRRARKRGSPPPDIMRRTAGLRLAMALMTSPAKKPGMRPSVDSSRSHGQQNRRPRPPP